MLIVTLFACGQGKDTATDDLTQEIEMTSLLAEQLTGSFDSSEQAASNSSYYSVSLKTCPVDAPELGDIVLYVEQAMVTDLDSPYRQRLYVIENLDDDKVQSVIYSVNNEEAFVGLCDQEEVVTFTASDASLREGCEVILRWNGDGFEGQTEGSRCSSSLNGASFATSIVTTTPDTITSWDQGWSSTGNQVWGAVDGPYLFNRLP